MKVFHLFPILFCLFCPIVSYNCEEGSDNPWCPKRSRTRRSVADGDTLPIPAEIPEKIKKFCEKDASYDLCIQLGLGKKDKFQWSSKNRFSVDQISDDDLAETRDEEQRGKRVATGGISCDEVPLHPGCQRNVYLDAFILWKIRKDCEIRPDGRFCHALDDEDSESFEAVSSSSESSSSESSEGSLSLNPFDIFRRILEAAGGRHHEAPEVSTTTVATPESSESGIKQFLDLLKKILEIERSKSVNCGKNSTVSPQVSLDEFLKLFERIAELEVERARNSESPESLTPEHQIDPFLNLLAEIIELQREMAENSGKSVPESPSKTSEDEKQELQKYLDDIVRHLIEQGKIPANSTAPVIWHPATPESSTTITVAPESTTKTSDEHLQAVQKYLDDLVRRQIEQGKIPADSTAPVIWHPVTPKSSAPESTTPEYQESQEVYIEHQSKSARKRTPNFAPIYGRIPNNVGHQKAYWY